MAKPQGRFAADCPCLTHSSGQYRQDYHLRTRRLGHIRRGIRAAIRHDNHVGPLIAERSYRPTYPPGLVAGGDDGNGPTGRHSVTRQLTRIMHEVLVRVA
jgi:hypothetical protein